MRILPEQRRSTPGGITPERIFLLAVKTKISLWIENWWGVDASSAWSVWVTVGAIALIAVLSYVVCVRVLTPVVNFLTKKTVNEWDDDLLNAQVLKAVSHLAPAIVVGTMLPDVLTSGSSLHAWTVKFTKIYILWAAIHLMAVFLHGVQDAIDKRHLLRRHNLEIVRQTVVLFIIIIGAIIGIGILINRDPLAILTGLGASAAVLMLVFRDTILGFVAGIQLTVNKMLGRGDWIVAPKAGANGEVVEVKLTTVKVRNWDNSIVTIPPYTLFSDSFQNFNAMREAGARRVARSVFIDQTTIRFLTPEEIDALRDKGLVDPDTQSDARIVNLGLLRRYMESFLADYPEIIHEGNGRKGLTLMVRQLQPTPQGVPLELYFFTSRTVWKPFEHLQADVFDHLYAVIPEFHLAVYQAPSSRDFSAPES